MMRTTALMRVLTASILAATLAAPAAAGAARKNLCAEGPVELTGTMGENRLFDPPEYWVQESEPCRVHIIELAAPNEACAKGAKLTAKGTVEYIKEDGEISLVRLVKPENAECKK